MWNQVSKRESTGREVTGARLLTVTERTVSCTLTCQPLEGCGKKRVMFLQGHFGCCLENILCGLVTKCRETS